MVSFSCENCGDVLTKKKLDQHYNRCHGQFTCIDCMTTFSGTSYRSHTSCMTEEQKYQGPLYKEKANKAKKSVSIAEPYDSRSKQPYVEDIPEQDNLLSNAVTIINAPPTAPSPPPSAGLGTMTKFEPKPNVFDFLVNDETPNASRTNLDEPMQMVAHAPPVFRSHSHSPPSTSEMYSERPKAERSTSYKDKGFTYGEGPIHSTHADRDMYRTPAAKESRRRRESPSRYAPEVVPSTAKKSTDKKRKRQVEDLDLSQAAAMDVDDNGFVPGTLQHSGLTGGLSRMLSKTGRQAFPPSPAYSFNGVDEKERDSDYTDEEETPLNTIKTRRDRERRPRDTKDKDRDGRRGRTSMTSAVAGALIKVRRGRRTSDESRPRKHHRSHRHKSDEHPDRDRHRRASGESETRRRKPKAIEWKDEKDNSDDEYEDIEDGANGQMILYKNGERRASSNGRNKAEWFLSFVTKGPDSEKGYSMNKALKRYHRERTGDVATKRDERDRDRIEDEKDLWKSLRLRRNDRGEIVLFILDGEE